MGRQRSFGSARCARLGSLSERATEKDRVGKLVVRKEERKTMRVQYRGPASVEEKKEFDQVTFDQIQCFEDVHKLRRLEQYMRDEGFPSTADAARVRLHEMGSRTFTDDEKHARLEAETELKRAREELSSWQSELGSLKARKDNRKAGREVPAVRDRESVADSRVKEFVEEELHANEVEWMAEREKEKGNELFKSGEYKESVEAYDKSIQLVSKAPTLANRAAAKLKLKLYDSAIEDCTLALQQNPKYVKVLMRRAVARMELMQYEEAHEDILAALEEAPGNKELEKMREKVLRKMPQTVTRVQIEEVSDSEDEDEVEKEKEKEKEKSGAEEINEDEIGKIVEITDEVDEEEIGQIVEITEEEETPAHTLNSLEKSLEREGESRTKIEIEICTDSEDESSDGESEEKQEVSTDRNPGPGSAFKGSQGSSVPPASSDNPSSSIPEEECEKAEELKMKGNKAYGLGDLNAALHWYTESIKYKECSAVYSNRAQLHLKMGNFNSAISDCTNALSLDKGNIKALYRRAMGMKEAGKIREALADFEAVKDKIPNRPDILEEVEALRKKLKEQSLKSKKEVVNEKVDDSSKDKKELHSPSKINVCVNHQLAVPKSSSEFEANVRFVRKNPNELAKYIYQIPVANFSNLFNKAFTPDVLGTTIEGLLAGFDDEGESFSFCLDVLDSFTQAERFAITSKMLTSKQKNSLRELFTRLLQASPNADKVATLKGQFGVK